MMSFMFRTRLQPPTDHRAPDDHATNEESESRNEHTLRVKLRLQNVKSWLKTLTTRRLPHLDGSSHDHQENTQLTDVGDTAPPPAPRPSIGANEAVVEPINTAQPPLDEIKTVEEKTVGEEGASDNKALQVPEQSQPSIREVQTGEPSTQQTTPSPVNDTDGRRTRETGHHLRSQEQLATLLARSTISRRRGTPCRRVLHGTQPKDSEVFLHGRAGPYPRITRSGRSTNPHPACAQAGEVGTY